MKTTNSKGNKGSRTSKPSNPEAKSNLFRERTKPKKAMRKGLKQKPQNRPSTNLRISQDLLPVDAEFKGYVVVQDIKLTTDNVLFRKQKYYSPQRENLLSGTTRWLRGEFGPGIKALVISLYYGSNMTQSKF